MTVGIGAYQGAQAALVAKSGVKFVLCHLNPQAAIAVRAANPHALIGLRADLGDDGTQVNFAGDPVSEAAQFATDRIIPARAAVPKGTYSFCVGINEAWPAKGDLAALRWRATFELTLCHIVQGTLKLPYAWGAIPVGNLEAAEVSIFADVFRQAWATNYHGYLAPGNTDLAQDTDAFYSHRPFELWLPELKKLGIPLRLLLGECGTFAAPNTYPGFDTTAEAYLAVAIAEDYEIIAQEYGFAFVGACAFGVGTVGTQAAWDLTADINVFAAAAVDDPQPGPIILPGGTVPNVGAGFAKCVSLIGQFLEDEVFEFNQTPNQTSLAVAQFGYATYRPDTNETFAHHHDGRVWADGGNHLDGTMRVIRPAFP